MHNIDFIYFDLGQVILDFDHERGCQQVSAMSGVPSEQVKQVIFDSGLQHKYEAGQVTCDEFHAAFCDATGSQPDRNELLSATSDIFEPNQSIFPLITQLRAVHFPMGILSNTCHAHWDFLCRQFTVLREYFKPLILSYEVNSMKPDEKIYKRAIELASCTAEKCFFVDDKQENVDGALAAGMDAVLYESVPALISQLSFRGVEVNL